MTKNIVDPKHIKEVSKRAVELHSAQAVEEALDRMAKEISDSLHEANPVVLCAMVGGIIPTGMLLTRLDFPLQVDYVHATRYGDDFSGQELKWFVKPRVSLKNRVVLVVDDILDGGLTLAGIIKYCYDEQASNVMTAVLVEKEVSRQSDAVQKADFTGVKVEDKFVFGCGMDYKRYLRNTPGIYAVNERDMSRHDE